MNRQELQHLEQSMKDEYPDAEAIALHPISEGLYAVEVFMSVERDDVIRFFVQYGPQRI